MIKMGSFRSYVDLEEYEMKIPAPVSGSFLQPKFIPGELVIAEATNVLKFTSLSKTKGLSGSLFVTNARAVFVSSDHVCSEDSFPLLSINTLWYYESNVKGISSSNASSGKKTRRKVKLGPMRNMYASGGSVGSGSVLQNHIQNYQNSSSSGSGVTNLISSSGSTRIHEIFIVCSNFRTLRISFKFSPIDQGLRICNAIIHHAFPEQLERLFYFDFCKAYTQEWTNALRGGGGGTAQGPTLGSNRLQVIPSYMDKGDWLRELNLARTTKGGYRISGINEGFQLCGSLPEWIVVPSDVNDARVMNLAEKLKGCRPPHWTWGDSRGASILIMGKLNNEQDSSAENSFFESLRKVHPNGLAPTIYDLDGVVTLKEIKQSFVALMELCCPESLNQYSDMDSKFYSSLEQTKWLQLVSRVLAKCKDIVDTFMVQGNAIIFQEQEGRDVSCLFSSLIQLIVDPRFRTVSGLFSLIQKDWVAFGHPFHSTHTHTSPVFLLFLDTVFQLMVQNPLDFEFNEQLLSSLWDSLFDCTTGTFLFDSPQQRKTMELCKDSTAWISIFSSNEANSSGSSTPATPQSSRRRDAPPVQHHQFTPKSPIPRSLLNPLFQVKSLLNSPVPVPPNRSLLMNLGSNSSPLHFLSSTNNNTHLLSSCNSAMCDLVFWDTLYLHRTLEITPMIVTSGESPVSEPFVPNSNSNSPAHSSPSPSSKFYFPLPPLVDSYQQKRRPGRDTLYELKIVEEILQNLSATTRFQRNLSTASTSTSQGIAQTHQHRHFTSSSSSSPQRHIISSSASSLHHRHPHHHPHQSHHQKGRLTSSATSSPVISSASGKFSISPGSASATNTPQRRNPFSINLTSATTTTTTTSPYS